MSLSDDRLMAYVDGELPPEVAAEVAALAAADPDLTARIERMRRVRALVAGAPRERAAEPQSDRDRLRRPVSWPMVGGMAACLAAGLFLGRAPQALRPPEILAARGGDMVAGGTLAKALESQLAAGQHDEAVRIGVSFVSRDGRYCRTFRIERSGLTGLACKEPTGWVARTAAASPAENSARGARQEASTLPAPVAAAVDQAIKGQPLDAAGEARAKARGWRD